MYSVPSFHDVVGDCSDSYEDPKLSPRSMAEAKAAAASNTHKEAERRRRKRINAHIATLKSVLPNTIKTDKASLLGEAVRRVKELKQQAAAVASDVTISGETNNTQVNPTVSTTSLKAIMFPTETDEVKVSRCGDNSGLVKATLCCDDRADIVRELIRAMATVQAKVVRAEMSTVGGRTRIVLWVRLSISSSDESDVGLGMLRRALRMVVDKSGWGLQGNKRAHCYSL